MLGSMACLHFAGHSSLAGVPRHAVQSHCVFGRLIIPWPPVVAEGGTLEWEVEVRSVAHLRAESSRNSTLRTEPIALSALQVCVKSLKQKN